MKPMPASRMHRPILSGVRSILTPRAASTSAAPERDESARLPCLATGTPAPATISAAQVEMLNEPEASPPVPTTSMASGGASTRSILARMALTAPVISSTVSPRTRRPISSAPICDGVASPAIICSKALAASSRPSDAPVATLAMMPRNSTVTWVPLINRGARSLRPGRRALPPSIRGIPCRSDVEKIPQHEMSVFGGDAFRMKLHAMDWQSCVCQRHHHAAIGVGRHGELARHRRTLHHQRVIARGFERRIDAAEDPGTVVADFRQLAVQNRRRSHHLAAECRADRLMPETNAEDRNSRRRCPDQIEANTGLVGSARTGRQDDGVRIGGDNRLHRHFVVPAHRDLGSELAEIVHKIEGETVVVIDQADHRDALAVRSTAHRAPRTVIGLPRLLKAR